MLYTTCCILYTIYSILYTLYHILYTMLRLCQNCSPTVILSRSEVEKMAVLQDVTKFQQVRIGLMGFRDEDIYIYMYVQIDRV